MDDKKNEFHPGWAVQFADGTWLGVGHGYWWFENATMAHIYNSVGAANSDVMEFFKDEPAQRQGYTIILAWEPRCLKFQSEVQTLQAATAIDPLELFLSLETIKGAVSTIEEMNKTFAPEEIIPMNEDE